MRKLAGAFGALFMMMMLVLAMPGTATAEPAVLVYSGKAKNVGMNVAGPLAYKGTDTDYLVLGCDLSAGSINSVSSAWIIHTWPAGSLQGLMLPLANFELRVNGGQAAIFSFNPRNSETEPGSIYLQGAFVSAAIGFSVNRTVPAALAGPLVLKDSARGSVYYGDLNLKLNKSWTQGSNRAAPPRTAEQAAGDIVNWLRNSKGATVTVRANPV